MLLIGSMEHGCLKIKCQIIQLELAATGVYFLVQLKYSSV